MQFFRREKYKAMEEGCKEEMNKKKTKEKLELKNGIKKGNYHKKGKYIALQKGEVGSDGRRDVGKR